LLYTAFSRGLSKKPFLCEYNQVLLFFNWGKEKGTQKRIKPPVGRKGRYGSLS